MFRNYHSYIAAIETGDTDSASTEKFVNSITDLHQTSTEFIVSGANRLHRQEEHGTTFAMVGSMPTLEQTLLGIGGDKYADRSLFNLSSLGIDLGRDDTREVHREKIKKNKSLLTMLLKAWSKHTYQKG